MRTSIIGLICCAASLLPYSTYAAEAIGNARTNRNDGTKKYVVMLKREADQELCVNEHAIARSRTFRHAINGFVVHLKPDAAERLRKDSRVAAIVEDRIVAKHTAQVLPSSILRIGANNFPPIKMDGTDKRVDVGVAVIDSGIQPDHPDLNVVQAVSVAGNGLVGIAHGTECAGIIGALDNDFGVVGVAPGVRLWSVRADQDGNVGYYTADIVSAFDYVSAHADQISVVNCSFGSFYGYLDLDPWFNFSWKHIEHEAVIGVVNRGVVVVAAAGNDARDIAGPDGIIDTDDDIVPAAFPQVMAVSGMNPIRDQLAGFSNFSASRHAQEFVFSPGAGIDVAAPATGVYTTALASNYALTQGDSGGTSFACPHVVGVVALYIAAHGRATNAAGVYAIRQAIIDAAQPQSQWQTTNTLDPDSHHEGLVLPSLAWLPNAPRFISIQNAGSSNKVTFTTFPGYIHSVQQSSSAAFAAWTDCFVTNGTGSNAVMMDSAEVPQKFYRLATQQMPWPPTNGIATATNMGSAGAAANGTYFAAERGASGAISGDPLDSAVTLAGGAVPSRVEVPFVPQLNPSGPFSVEFWVKPDQVANIVSLAESLERVGADQHYNGWILYQANATTAEGNGFRFVCWSDSGRNTQISARATLPLDTNSWYHLVGVFDGTSVILYVNGSAVATTPFPDGQVLRPNPEAVLRFGANYDLGFPYSGDLDEGAIYTSPLSAAQVLAHYQAGTNAAPVAPYSQVILNDHPAGYWRFNEQ